MDAWLVCNDLLIRAKNLLYSDALELFEKEIKLGRINVKGSFVKFEDPQNSNDREFLLMKFIDQKDDMIRYYSSQLSNSSINNSQRTNLLGFLKDIEIMSTLIGYSKIFDEWAAEALHDVKITDATELLAKGIKHKPARLEALYFLLSEIKTSKDAPFSNEEVNIFEKVAAMSKNHSQ